MAITFSDTHFWQATYRNGTIANEYSCARQNVDYANLAAFSLIPKNQALVLPILTIHKQPGYRMLFAARRFGSLDIKTGQEIDEGTDYEIGLVVDDGCSELADMERGGIWPDLDFSGGFLAILPRVGDIYLRFGKAKLTRFDNNYLFEVI